MNLNKTISRFLLFSLVLPLLAAIPEPVRVEQGLLSSVESTAPEVRVFKGVPFAGAPLSDLRWHAPKPAAKWTGVRNASEFSAICMQRRPNAAGIGPAPADERGLSVPEYLHHVQNAE
jgi:para-nitrobenzyl esterase